MNKKAFLFLIVSVLILLNGVAYAQTSQPNSLVLKLGFNFVSFTAKPSITPADFKNVYYSSTVEEVYTYSAVSGSFLSVGEGTLTAFNLGRGYIIKAKAAQNIYLDGVSAATIGDIKLKAGFNLLGFSKVPETIKFTELMKKYSVIKGLYKWSAASGSFIQVIRNGSNDPELLDGVDPAITVGQAYFINVTADTSLNYDGDTIKFEGGSIVTPGVKTLVELVLSKASDTVLPGGNYDLKNLSVTAKYSDGTSTMIISPWVIASGGGSISNQVFTAASINETVTFTCTYHDDDGTAKSASFTLTVGSGGTTPTVGNKAVVTSAGAKLTISNGITLEIPANSVDVTGEISMVEIQNNDFGESSQNVFSIETNNEVFNASIKISVDSDITAKDIKLTCIIPEANKITHSDAVIINNIALFTLKSRSLSPLSRRSRVNYSSVDDAEHNQLLKRGKTYYIIQRYNKNDGSKLINKFISGKSYIGGRIWPYYRQYYGTCWAAVTLMLMKGYKPFGLSDDFNSIYKIVHKVKANRTILSNDPATFNVFGIVARWASVAPPYNKLNYMNINYLDFFLTNVGLAGLQESIFKSTGYGIEFYYSADKRIFVNNIVQQLDNNKPVAIMARAHGCLLIDYSCNSIPPQYTEPNEKVDFIMNNIQFIAHDPRFGTYQPINLADLIAYNGTEEDFISFNARSNEDIFSKIKTTGGCTTIHLPDDEYADPKVPSLTTHSCVGFIKTANPNDVMVARSRWGAIEENNSYKWQDSLNGIINIIPEFDEIVLNNIPIFNASQATINSSHIKISILSDTYQTLISKDLNIGNITPSGTSKLGYSSYQMSPPHYSVKSTKEFVNDFKKAIPNTTNNEYILKMELLDQNNSLLDGFDIKFKYKKLLNLFLNATPSTIKLGEECKLKAGCGYDADTATPVSDLVEWTDSNGNVYSSTSKDGLVYKPNKAGVIRVKAKLPKGKEIAPGNITTEDMEVTIDITVTENDGGNLLLNVLPETATLYADSTLKFTGTVSSGGIDWLIQEQSEGGTLAADGTYKAPSNVNLYYYGDSKYHVIAQSQINPTVKKIIEVTIVRPQLAENIKTSEYDFAASGYFNVMYSAIRLRNLSTGANDLVYYHGPYKKYYDSYVKLNADGFYEKGKKTNVWTYYDSNSNKTETRTYSNDMLNGLKTKYWTSGKKQEETNYTNDVPEGLYTSYNNNASNSIYSQGNYAVFNGPNGRYHYKVGIWKTYYNELYTTTCAYITEEPYVNGYETGTEKSYYPNGNKRYEQEYLNSKKEGLFKSYADNNKLAEESYFKNDLYDGLYKKYDYVNNSAVILEGNYALGKREGIWISRDLYGKDYEYNEYRNDVWINVTFPKSSMLPYREIEWNKKLLLQ